MRVYTVLLEEINKAGFLLRFAFHGTCQSRHRYASMFLLGDSRDLDLLHGEVNFRVLDFARFCSSLAACKLIAIEGCICQHEARRHNNY